MRWWGRGGMNIQRARHRIVSKIAVVAVGILIIVGLVVAAKIFFRGFIIGVALTLIACIIVIVWMKRSAGGDK
jgi:hypothetical protein